MGKSLQFVFLSLFVLLFAVQPVTAYYIYGSTWYIYIIVVFVVIAISSCIGACVRYRRNQMILEQQRIMVGTGNAAGISVTTSQSQVNAGFYPYPGQYPPGTYPQYPPTEPQQPPAYQSDQAGAAPVKDPNLPPAYDEAVTAPSVPGAAPYPTQPGAAPYPTQPGAAPYPTQPGAAPYPTQTGAAPYPTQPSTTPYPAPPN